MILVNVGLAIGKAGAVAPWTMRAIAPWVAIAALRDTGAGVLQYAVRQSNTELTLVAQLDRALAPAEAYTVAEVLQQEAIAQVVDGVGELYGPNAAAWQPFNPEYFLDLTGPAL